jgi:hypothetical protein
MYGRGAATGYWLRKDALRCEASWLELDYSERAYNTLHMLHIILLLH